MRTGIDLGSRTELPSAGTAYAAALVAAGALVNRRRDVMEVRPASEAQARRCDNGAMWWRLATAASVGLIAVSVTTSGAAGPSVSSRTLETISVSNTSPTPVVSRTVLREDHGYRITASGTISDWCPEKATSAGECSLGSPLEIGKGVDALYCYAAWHECSKRGPGGGPALWRQLGVRLRGSSSWLGLDQLAGKEGRFRYSRFHIYAVDVAGLSGRLELAALDALGSPGDNSGAFTVYLDDRGPLTGLRRVEVGWDPDGRRFVPSGAILRSGATVRICNRTGDVHEAFSTSPYNRIELGRLSPGECRAVQVRNRTSKPIQVNIRDSAHPTELLVLTVLPARR